MEEKMKQTDDPVLKARLKVDISKIKAEFREKRKNARRSLFAKA